MLLYVWEKFQSISFFKKLFLYFLVLCIIPILIITQTLYSQGKTTIQTSTTDFIQLYVSQLNTTLNNYILQIDYTSRSIFSDYNMIAYLQGESVYSTGERIENNLLISRQLLRFYDQLPYVESVQIISKEGKQYSTGNINALTDYKLLLEQKWFQEILKANGELVITPYYGKTTLKEKEFDVFTAGRLIKDQQGKMAGVILFELSSASLITMDNRLFDIRDQYQSQILVYNKYDELLFDISPEYGASDQPIIKRPAELDDSILSITDRSSATGINVAVFVPVKNLYKQLEHYKRLSILITLLILVIIIPASIWISYQITKPIQRLIYNMKHVEQGYYRPILGFQHSDELGTLTKHYNQMIVQIKHLIEDVLASKIKQNEARFLALQNQINPHWLNNTLESIRMEAQLNKAPTVAKMIQTLGKLFQIALNKSNRKNQIRHEMEYIDTYIALQNIRFDNRFHLHVELDEQLLDIQIPRIIFQPLIENSIIHGFLRHDRHYHIYINGSIGIDSCTISIRDDGEGMTEEELAFIRTSVHDRSAEEESTHSLGLKNVVERLQLHYGEALAFHIDSSPGVGTNIMISFPVNPI